MSSSNKEIQLEAARALVSALESDDEVAIQVQLHNLTEINESDLFKEVGKLTRELHDALNNFQVDSTIVDLANEQIPNTRERLNFVIETTEEAAHKTLESIDKTIPITQELRSNAEKINESWQRFRKKEMTVEEFRLMANEIETYLPKVKIHADAVHQNLSEMMMAQGFQDLTGQVIRQVIQLTEEVEENLVRLVKVAGTHQAMQPKSDKKVDPIKAEGPQINADTNPNVVNNQDDVDDLLSSLGF